MVTKLKEAKEQGTIKELLQKMAEDRVSSVTKYYINYK